MTYCAAATWADDSAILETGGRRNDDACLVTLELLGSLEGIVSNRRLCECCRKSRWGGCDVECGTVWR
jgi:hypothetical protein